LPALLALLCAAACQREPVDQAGITAAEDAASPLTAETREGPIAATVSLTPAEPRLGDSLTLTLSVEAEANVVVDMPAFGDALGRFAIVDYAPREEVQGDGATRYFQRYTLEAPMSGRQRIPKLRIEYLDERDPTSAARSRELLTDELGFTVASVLPEGEVSEMLRPARGPLAELEGPWLERHWPWLAALLALLIGAGVGILLWLRRAAERARLTAYDRAWARLDRLQRAGLPDAGRLDGWYVELSDIVRRYIEERFRLRAPELTTEEFLLEARRAADLSGPHRELLSAFLERCDRVKFARYSPGEGESREALALARRFLEETRAAPVAEAPAATPAPAAA
jgi:hypothetical protein